MTKSKSSPATKLLSSADLAEMLAARMGEAGVSQDKFAKSNRLVQSDISKALCGAHFSKRVLRFLRVSRVKMFAPYPEAAE